MRSRGVGRADEIADRRLRELGDAAEAGKRGRRHAALPARDGDRLDTELGCKLFLGQADAAPRSAQTFPHPAALVGTQALG